MKIAFSVFINFNVAALLPSFPHVIFTLHGEGKNVECFSTPIFRITCNLLAVPGFMSTVRESLHFGYIFA
jgi:hypothetical protein